MATTAAEARFRIDYPEWRARDSRIIALDDKAGELVRRIAARHWSGAHFLTFEGSTSLSGNGDVPSDARLRGTDESETLLSAELADADVAVMIATGDEAAQAAAVIGEACAARGIMTAGMVLTEEGQGDEAVFALRPYAMVLVALPDEDDLLEILTALRA